MSERQPGISDIFYYFEEQTDLDSGRTVGRKIGVVQEILLRKYLEVDPAVHRRMYLEQFLFGISGADHKVEFSWFPLESYELAQGSEIPDTGGCRVKKIDAEGGRITVDIPGGNWGSVTVDRGSPSSGKFREYLDRQARDLRIASIHSGAVQLDVIDSSQVIASLESKRVGAQRFSGSDKLGSGIQTIEKAKQCSLVALDLDLKHNGNVKPLEEVGEPKKLISCVALGNGVHWTTKDRAIMGTFVDFTFLVKDQAIIRYAEFVKELAGAEGADFMPFFMDYFGGMTTAEPDDFEVTDDDFEVIAPERETRSLRQIISEHVLAVDYEHDERDRVTS